MRALVKLKREPGIWMQEMPEPEYGINDVLIKVHQTAICGTDIHIYQWDEWAQATIPVPMITGHEFFGEIVAFGSEVKGFRLGQRVSGEGHITCGLCRNCRGGREYLCRNVFGTGVDKPGCFADYVVMPASNVIAIPDSISGSLAAIMDPLGNAVHCALSFPVAGEDVLITGAGPVGIMAAAVVKHLGARHVVITDVNDYRLSLAAKMGASRTVNVQSESLEQVRRELAMEEGFGIGLEMSGNPLALNDLLVQMNHGGQVAILGIPPGKTAIDWNQVIFKGLVLKGIYGREMYETWYKMISMLESGLNIEPIITHNFPVAEYQQAFKVMASGNSGKVILNW